MSTSGLTRLVDFVIEDTEEEDLLSRGGFAPVFAAPTMHRQEPTANLRVQCSNFYCHPRMPRNDKVDVAEAAARQRDAGAPGGDGRGHGGRGSRPLYSPLSHPPRPAAVPGTDMLIVRDVDALWAAAGQDSNESVLCSTR